MRKLILLLCGVIVVPAFANIQYTNINDGLHMVSKGAYYEGTELMTTSNTQPSLKAIDAYACDTTQRRGIPVNWQVTINNNSWHYTMIASILRTRDLFAMTPAIYKIDIKGSINPQCYIGPYAYIRSDTSKY